MQEVLTVKANVGCLPGYPEQGKRKEWSVEDMKIRSRATRTLRAMCGHRGIACYLMDCKK